MAFVPRSAATPKKTTKNTLKVAFSHRGNIFSEIKICTFAPLDFSFDVYPYADADANEKADGCFDDVRIANDRHPDPEK